MKAKNACMHVAHAYELLVNQCVLYNSRKLCLCSLCIQMIEKGATGRYRPTAESMS